MEEIEKDFELQKKKENEKDEINLNETLPLDNDEVKNTKAYGYETEEEIEEEKILLSQIFNNKINAETEKANKTVEKQEKIMQKIEKKIKKQSGIPSPELKYSEKKLAKRLKSFFLKAYDIISKNNYDRIIEDEDDDEIEDSKETKHLLSLINQIILEKENQNCKMKIIFGEKEKKIIDREFIINLYVDHKIKKFNELLKINIIFKVKIEMSVRSGNVKLTISKYSINYDDNKQEIIIEPNFKCLLINNNLGNYSVTYCTCGKCMNCKNRNEPKPFDDVLLYLKEKNGISNNYLEYTVLWFGKYNKYRNESGYKCSFCQDFYSKKLNIVKLFCNPNIDPDHTCIFWICRDCYNKKMNDYYYNYYKDDICPNCGKFKINFSKLRSIYYYLKRKNYILDIQKK